MPGWPQAPRYNASSLARALTILDLFEPATPALSATQIARRLRVRPGSLYPALSTLERFGYLDPAERRNILAGRELERRTPKIITNLKRLEADLTGIVAKGYGVDDEELNEGVLCVAAPVRDHAGEVVAAISISLLKARVKGGQCEKIAQAVMRAATAISGAMGYRRN